MVALNRRMIVIGRLLSGRPRSRRGRGPVCYLRSARIGHRERKSSVRNVSYCRLRAQYEGVPLTRTEYAPHQNGTRVLVRKAEPMKTTRAGSAAKTQKNVPHHRRPPQGSAAR